LMITSLWPRLSCNSDAMRLRSFSWESINCRGKGVLRDRLTPQLVDAILPDQADRADGGGEQQRFESPGLIESRKHHDRQIDRSVVSHAVAMCGRDAKLPGGRCG
jgi:hypothetical protein